MHRRSGPRASGPTHSTWAGGRAVPAGGLGQRFFGIDYCFRFIHNGFQWKGSCTHHSMAKCERGGTKGARGLGGPTTVQVWTYSRWPGPDLIGRKVKFTGLARNLGLLQASSRDFQSNCWVGLKTLGQPCEFQALELPYVDYGLGGKSRQEVSTLSISTVSISRPKQGFRAWDGEEGGGPRRVLPGGFLAGPRVRVGGLRRLATGTARSVSCRLLHFTFTDSAITRGRPARKARARPDGTHRLPPREGARTCSGPRSAA
jgi:hypothetical protein